MLHCTPKIGLLSVKLPEYVRLSQLFLLFKLIVLVSLGSFDDYVILPCIGIACAKVIVKVSCCKIRRHLFESYKLLFSLWEWRLFLLTGTPNIVLSCIP